MTRSGHDLGFTCTAARIADAQPPRMLQDNCDGLVPFSELNGKRS